jgi:hypothetical protein
MTKITDPIVEGIKESIGLAIALLMGIAKSIAFVSHSFINHTLKRPGHKHHVNSH